MGVRRTALVLASVVLGLGSMLAALPWATAAQAATAPAVTSATTILDVPTVGGVIHFGRTTAGDPGVVGVTASGPVFAQWCTPNTPTSARRAVDSFSRA